MDIIDDIRNTENDYVSEPAETRAAEEDRLPLRERLRVAIASKKAARAEARDKARAAERTPSPEEAPRQRPRRRDAETEEAPRARRRGDPETDPREARQRQAARRAAARPAYAEEDDLTGTEGETLPGQMRLPLHPIRRIFCLVGIGALLLVVLFLLIKVIGLPGDGADLRLPTQPTPPAASQSGLPQGPETDSIPAEVSDTEALTGTSEAVIPVSDTGEIQATETEPPERFAAQDLVTLVLAPVTRVLEPAENSELFQFKLPAPEDRTPEQSITLVAVGDNLMHNTVMWAGETKYGYDYTPLYRYIKADIQAADIACINQETIYVNDKSKHTNYPNFGGPTAIGDALIDTGFDVIEQASNHCYDKFDEGIHDTIDFWRQHPEITFLGIHDSQADADTIRIVERSGIRIAFLNYTYDTNVPHPSESWMVDYLEDKDKIAEDIAKAKALSDFVIVFPHWGAENTYRPNDYQKEWAQFFADQGVGAVIGCHTHTLQPVEVYTRADGSQMPVYWSLGNFISHMAGYQNMLGGMAKLTISRDAHGVYVSSYELIPMATYGTHDNGRWEFYAMKLEDYTADMAKHHLIKGATVQKLWDLYEFIVSED